MLKNVSVSVSVDNAVSEFSEALTDDVIMPFMDALDARIEACAAPVRGELNLSVELTDHGRAELTEALKNIARVRVVSQRGLTGMVSSEDS
jgi:hypothetical protein